MRTPQGKPGRMDASPFAGCALRWHDKTSHLIAFLILFAVPSLSGTMIVVRHGHAFNNFYRISCANPERSLEYPLTPDGIKQVEETAKKLQAEHADLVKKIRFVYVSPVHRAQQTAQILMEKLGLPSDMLVTDYTITESGFGDQEGQPSNVRLHLDPEYAKAHFAETDAEVSERSAAFVKRIKKVHENDTLLVVTHGSPMMEILNHAEEPKGKHSMPGNAEFRVLNLSAKVP